MKRAANIALGVLVATNVVVWRDRSLDGSGEFDVDAFASGVAMACAPVEMAAVRFEDEGLLPEGYSYFEGDAESPWLSVYSGYFPGGGLLSEEPHDPAVCYTALGWNILEGPEAVDVAGREVTRLVVQREEEIRVALYWQQRPAAAGESAWRRVVSARSDLVWIRVEEAYDAEGDGTLTEVTRRRLEAIAGAAAAALR